MSEPTGPEIEQLRAQLAEARARVAALQAGAAPAADPPDAAGAPRLEFLAEAGGRISMARDAPQILRLLVEAAMQLTGAARGTAGLVAGAEMVFREVREHGEWRPLDLHIGAEAASALTRRRTPYFAGPDESEPPTPALAPAVGEEGFAHVPLLGRAGEVIGCFQIYPDAAAPAASAEARPVLQVLAAAATAALDAARVLAERERAQDALRRQYAFTAAIAESLAEGLVALDVEGRVTFLNPAAATMLGWPQDALLGQFFHDRVHYQYPDGRPMSRRDCALMAAVNKGRAYRAAHDVLTRRDGALLPVACAAEPLLAAGQLAGAVVTLHDITQQLELEQARAVLLTAEQSARADAEATEARMAFLAEASVVLASSLEHEVILTALAQLAVPRLADWCAVDLLDDDGLLRRVAVAHTDPAKVALAHELARRFPADPKAPTGAYQVARSGRPEMAPDISDALLAELVSPPELLAIIRELGLRSSLSVPLTARGRTLGVITLIFAESGRRYDSAQLGLAEDLARRAGLAVDNARLYREAQAAVRVRDEFLSIASHELKTPLTSLQLQAQLLLRLANRGTLSAMEPGRVRAMLETSERQIKQLTRLIDDLLDITHISAGRLQITPGEVDLVEVARNVMEQFGVAAARAGCALTLRAEQPAIGHWDRARLEQVAGNLLSNAIKYGRGQPIEIAVTADAGRARLAVTDHGIGIAPHLHARIFERFERGVSAEHYGGLGLGLYIVRHIVESLGGAIRVESAPGAGATFTVELPTALPP
jgi:PAS domain S-box-containing protein